jgi:alpha-D-ribose 1-methylphosphonate 5-triphosphate diphosphatase PhnM
LLGLDDRGVLAEGKRADISICEINNNKITVKQTIAGGKLVYR